MNKRFLTILLFLSLSFEAAFAVDFWQYPEAAEKGSIFASGFMASLEISSPGIDGLDFSFFMPEFCIDYVLPIGLPFSFGLSLLSLEDTFFAIGVRPAYHVNLGIDWLGLYVMYPITVISSEEALTFKYGAGIGLRARVKEFFGLAVEIRPPQKGLLFGVSLKLN